MKKNFDFIVVGKGMMGAAAARHLCRAKADVLLIGPDEPHDKARHNGVFASHYDSGRITRTIDGDADWALLANRSIARYREIEEESGISFFTETGCLMAGPAPTDAVPGFLQPVVAVRDRFGMDAPLLDHDALSQRFPWFSFPAGSAGVLEEKGAGCIDPRKLVQAQVDCVLKAGGAVVRSQVVAVRTDAVGTEVVTADGERFRGGQVLVAAGGFSISPNLLPDPLDLIVKARTVFLAELSQDDAARYAGMPSMIDETGSLEEHFYLLPPLRYPDGKVYLKTGGDPVDIVLEDEAAIVAWFRNGSNPRANAHLEKMMRRVVPDLQPLSTEAMRCVTTYTRHGYPYIGFTNAPNLAVLTGGNGTAAKSSDEIGRLGASLLLGNGLDSADYTTDFAVCYR